MKYKDALVAGEAKIEADLVPFKVTQAQKQCEIEVSKMEESIAGLELKLARAASAHPLNLTEIVNATNTIMVAKKNLETAKKVIADLF
jgi:predicted S18 family serine protease